ncbi:MAG: RNA polymerase sigma factor [Verrucomicrobia bacterium]|nr:RNA polymerase sigma factor [Verrucomicrobiota bacterium]
METQTASIRPLAELGRSPVLPQRMPMDEKTTLRMVFEAEESPLLRYAYGLVGQRETAEDLVQEAFVRLHAHWDEVANPRAWLFRTIHNLALNHLRDHQRETSFDTSQEWASASPDPEQALGKLEAIGTLQLLIAELPSEDRRLIRLKYHQHLKYDQISQCTGLSVGNVGYKLHHLLKHLADALRHLGIDSAEG